MLRAIVFSGGGAKGAYEAGLIQSLTQEFNESFDIICGTSIGAINASFVAQDKIQPLVDLWQNISKDGIVNPTPRVAALLQLYESLSAYFQSHPLQKIAGFPGEAFNVLKQLRAASPLAALEAIVGALDPTGAQTLLRKNLDLNALTRVLITSTTDLTMRRQGTFFAFPDKYAAQQAHFQKEEPWALPFPSNNFSETVRASGAIPGAFAPVSLLFGDVASACVDGGVTNNTPIGQAVDAGADEITIVYVDPETSQTPQPSDNLVEILLGCFSMMQQRILDLDYTTAIRVNDAVGANAKDTVTKKIVRLRKFRPDSTLPPGIIDFDNQLAVDAAFAVGQADARNVAKRNAWAS